MSAKLKGWLVVSLLLGTAVYAIAEDITLTTYYPSPRGVYQELKTAGDMVVGDITNPPAARLHVVGDGSAPALRVDDAPGDPSPLLIESGQLQLGNLASDPAAIGDGALYYNTTDDQFHGFQAGAWQDLGGGAIELMTGSNPVCGAGKIPLARRIIPFEAKWGWPGACNYGIVTCAGWTGTQWRKVGQPIPAETSTPANCGAGGGAHPTTTCQEYCNVTLGYPLGACDSYDGANGPNGTPAWDMVLCASP